MKIIFILLANCMIFVAQAQDRMVKILSYPLSNDEMGIVIAREDYLSNHKFNSPWLRELDFRIRPNNLETSLSDYRVRFGILNPAEMKANRDYHKLLINQQSFERTNTINSVLKRRYELIIEAHYLNEMLRINKENLDRLKEIASLILEEGVDIGEIIKLEEQITKQELSINGIHRNIQQLKQAFKNFGLEDIPAYNEESWISIEQIDSIVSQSVNNETMELVAIQQDLAREETILKINKAEAFSNLGFIQAEYDDERGDSRDEHIRFQLGIQIPIFNTDRPDLQRRELELIEEKAEFNTLIQEEKNEQNQLVLELADYLNEWNLIEEKTKKLEEYKTTVDELGGDVKTYDRLRSYAYFLADKQLRVRMDVFVRFINHLALIGKLADQPYQNFLATSLESFELN